jgi:hypothetical protein
LRRPGFELESGYMGFVVGKVALGQIFSAYFCLPYQFAFHRLLHLSSGAGTIAQSLAALSSGLSHPMRKNNSYFFLAWCLIKHRENLIGAVMWCGVSNPTPSHIKREQTCRSIKRLQSRKNSSMVRIKCLWACQTTTQHFRC